MTEETIDGAQNLSSQNTQFDKFLAQSDFLNPARIEQPVDPKLQWQSNFSNPTNFIKDGTAGVSPNVPPSAVRQLSQSGAMSPFASMIAKQQQKVNSLTDYSSYAEPYAYDASSTGTFRDRYKGYGQETFNKIGFHPLIDNETWFNQNTTFGDDLKRWATHSAWPMFTKGIMDPIRSYKSIMDGEGLFYADPEGARDYQYYNALGQSTKGGLGGFTVNLLNSASYSLGILTEGAIEGALIGSLFGGPAGAVEGSMSIFQKLSNLPKGFANLAKGTAKMLDDVNNYTNLSKAKEYWAKAGTNFGNFANPLQNTMTALKNTDNLTNLARTSVTAGAFWHDVMAMNLALSEGKLEGGFTRNEGYERLYNKFIEENDGRAPNLREQEKLMIAASKGSWWNTHNNTALIYYTNKLVFPSITKASFLRGAPKFAFGKTVTNVGKEYQILFEPGKKLAEGQFVKEKINLINAIKSLGRPATYGKVGLNYFKANVMEGVQEVAQDVLQDATQNYYVETFFNPDARNFRYGSGLVGDAIAKQWSTQGLETFLSGFLMGTILQAPGKIKNYATIGYNDYFKKDAQFQEYRQGREKMADDIVNELNTLYKNANYFFDPRISNYAQQGLMSKVIDNPNEHTTKEIKDTEFAAFQSALYASLERGTFDMFLNHYRKYQQASASDIEQAWNLQPGQGEKALERFEETLKDAEKVAYRYNTAKEKMKEFRINLNDYEKDTEEYRMAQVYNKAFNLGINSYVFMHESYDNNLKRINALYKQLGNITSLASTPITNITALVDPGQLKREVEMLKTEVESLESITTQEALAELTRKREQLELYTRYNDNLEKVYGLFVNKEALNARIKEIEEKSKIDSEDEQVVLDVFKSIVNQFESGLTTTDKTFKQTFNDLLIGLGKTNEDRRKIQDEIDKQGGIDLLYDALLDTLILKNENSVLNQYTNLLASPNGFYEHVVRNFKFMRDLYNNREDIVKDIVNQEISAIERNTLLNTLADQGIFLDLEEFSKWIEDHNYRPEYFIDVKNNRKIMITEDSLIYEDYLNILRRAAELDERKPAGEKLNLKEQLDRKVAELIEERDRLIQKETDKYNAAFEKKYGLTPEQYEAEEEKRIAGETLTPERKKELEDDKKILEDAIKSLTESTSAVIIQAAADVVANKIMSKDNIKAPDYFAQEIDAILINPERKQQVDQLAPTITEAQDGNQMIDAALKSIIYKEWATQKLGAIELELTKEPAASEVKVEETKEYISFQETIKSIIEKYDRLIAEVKAEFEKKGVNENTPKVYSTKSDFEEFDPEFKQEITKLFEEYLVDTLEESPELRNTNPEQYERLRKNWLETQSELINSFNQRAKQKAEEKAQRLSQPPKLTFIDRQIEATTTTQDISQVIRAFEKFLKDEGYTNKKGEFVKLTKTDVQKIKNDLEALKGYLKARVDAAAPRNIAEEVVNIIQDNIIDKQNELEDIYDEDGNRIGRKFKDSENVPERTTKVAEEVENSIQETDPYVYFAIRDEVDEETGELLQKSPVEQLYDRIFNDPNVAKEDRVKAFMTAFEERVYGKGTKENPGFRAFAYAEKIAAVKNSLETNGTYEHLRETIKREAHRESSDSGNVVDDLIRIFLTLNASTESGFSEFTYDSELEIKGRMTKISDVMSKKAFDKLFAPVSLTSGGGIVTRFRLGIIDGTYTILSENVKLFDRNLRENGLTGELDLILIKEDGTVAIVDIKTSTEKKWEKFGTGEGYEKSIYFRAQQSIYGYMFYNNTGITPELKLMPFSVILSDKKVGYIEDIDLAGIVSEGQDTIDLEYLPEIEDFGIIKTEPENVIVRPKEKTEEKDEGNTIPPSDPTKLTLEDNLNKRVMYKGRVGTLIQMPNGTFAIEVPISVDLSTIQITLESLRADKLLAQEYGSQEEIQDINNQIDRLEKAIKSQEGLTEIYPIEKLDVKIVNEKLTLADVGLQIIAPVESVGQVSVIDGEVVNASFSNPEETIASINGVKYNVNRDKTGAIISLSYQSNDVEISRIDKEISEINSKIYGLRERVKTEEDQFKRNRINDRIADLQREVSSLSSRRSALYNSNKTQYLYGANANNYIFALNRLPNNFQRLTQKLNRLDETQDLKLIDKLSLSTAISQTITEILSEEYPEELDRLFTGNFDYKFTAKNKINKWIDTSIEKLYQLGYTVLNRGDLVDDIQGQINALLELKNDIALIKLTRDKKIKNYGEVRKIFTEGQRVQKRTRVPKNEKPTGGQTKGGTRPSTKEELREIVRQARKKIDPELENLPEVSEEDIKLNKLIENINNAKLDNITAVYQKAVLEAMKNKLKIDGLKKAYENRLAQLNTQISIDTINKGEYLISKKAIFDDPSQTIYQVVRINKQSVRVRNIVSQVENTINENELMDNFEKTTEEATQPASEVKIDSVDIEGANESKDVVKDLANDTVATNAAKENAKKSNLKSRFDKLKDNSKKC